MRFLARLSTSCSGLRTSRLRSAEVKWSLPGRLMTVIYWNFGNASPQLSAIHV